jgi:hypothetical protein
MRKEDLQNIEGISVVRGTKVAGIRRRRRVVPGRGFHLEAQIKGYTKALLLASAPTRREIDKEHRRIVRTVNSVLHETHMQAVQCARHEAAVLAAGPDGWGCGRGVEHPGQ